MYQYPILVGCCALVYHVAVIRTNAGSAVASAAPERTRRMARSVKFRLAAWDIRRIPHTMICTVMGLGWKVDNDGRKRAYIRC